MARAFGSFVDCVLDGVLSAAGAYGSAALPDVFAAIASRSAMHYANGAIKWGEAPCQY